MSVPVNLRSKSKLEVCVKALDLCTYTLRITANPKVFVPAFQNSLTYKISDTGIEIHENVWNAHNVTTIRTYDDLLLKQRYQEEAIRKCNMLLSLMDIAKPIFHLDTKRIVYWGTLCLDTRKLITDWKVLEYNKYKHLKP